MLNAAPLFFWPGRTQSCNVFNLDFSSPFMSPDLELIKHDLGVGMVFICEVFVYLTFRRQSMGNLCVL